MSKHYLVFILGIFFYTSGKAQLTATFTTTINTICNGSDCDYTGPSILINELMISPTNNDGSISGPGGVSEGRGEWIELYNPNLCEPVDISCYYLGNNTAEGNGGYVIPSGTIIPPAGFCMIRGATAAPVPANLLVQNGGNVVELVVPYNVFDAGVCTNGTRVWFPNAGGWFAFYDNNGVPQDAVSWASAAGVAGAPCVALLAGCNAVASLPSYNAIPNDRKQLISTLNASDHLGNSLRRIPDGGAWSGNGAPTYAICNGPCETPGVSTCSGTATVTPSGGTPPYTYQWNDSQAQMTATAVGLCEGTYAVIVTDNSGTSVQFTVTIQDFVPTVTIDVPSSVCIDLPSFAITNVSPIASGGATGVISGTGINAGNFNPSNAGQGSHTITYTYTDENGCTNSASDPIVVNPLPIVTITNNLSPYCISSNPANLTLTPNGGTLTGSGVTNNQFIPSSAGLGTHQLTYTYTNADGCTNSTTISVDVVSIPTPSITAPDVLCTTDDPVTITGTPSGGNFTINGINTAILNPSQTGAGNVAISYLYTDPNGCQASAADNVIILPSPQLTFDLQDVFCIDNYTNVALIATPAGGTFSGIHVNGSSIQLSGVGSGNYTTTYTFTDPNGCFNSITESYLVTSPIYPSFNTAGDCFQNLTMSASPFNPAFNYAWSINSTPVANSHVTNQYFSAWGDNFVSLTISDQYQCTYDTTIVVFVEEGVNINEFFIPNVITPNGDNINEQVEIPLPIDICLDYTIIFTNRWGNVVFEMDSMSNPFRGKDKSGNDLAEGIYFYVVNSEGLDCTKADMNGKCHGFIHIVR